MRQRRQRALLMICQRGAVIIVMLLSLHDLTAQIHHEKNGSDTTMDYYKCSWVVGCCQGEARASTKQGSSRNRKESLNQGSNRFTSTVLFVH